jgi:hypothetical protein
MSDPELFDAIFHKLREDGVGGYVATNLLTIHEIGVLWTCLNLLNERGVVEVTGMAADARWPRHEPPIPRTEGLRDALMELRREKWLAFTIEGDVTRIKYGERIKEIAAKWGVPLADAADA